MSFKKERLCSIDGSVQVGIGPGPVIGPANFHLIGPGPGPGSVQLLDRRSTVRYRSKVSSQNFDFLGEKFKKSWIFQWKIIISKANSMGNSIFLNIFEILKRKFELLCSFFEILRLIAHVQVIAHVSLLDY